VTEMRISSGEEDQLRTMRSVDAAIAEIGAEAALDALCKSVAEVVRAAPGPPARVRVRFGCASVDVQWQPASPTALVATPPPVSEPAEDGAFTVRAPLVGTFYRAAEPGTRPFVEVGELVRASQQVAIVEAMKLMNPIVTERSGRVVEVLVADGALVEYDQPLILLEPVEEP
jgi:acetyl-CoA carboxylase biotin carboxyl carrier protein